MDLSWRPSFGSDFNADFSVSFTERQQREQGIAFNYQREAPQSQGNQAPEIPTRLTPRIRMRAPP